MKKFSSIFFRLCIFYLINFILLFIFFLILYRIFYLCFPFVESNLALIEGAFDAAAVLLISYGVAIEENEALMKILSAYPKKYNKFHKLMDHITHDCGLLILVLGLAIEIPVQLLKVSNDIIDTLTYEKTLIAISYCLLILGGIILIFYSILLVIKLSKIQNKAD